MAKSVNYLESEQEEDMPMSRTLDRLKLKNFVVHLVLIALLSVALCGTGSTNAWAEKIYDGKDQKREVDDYSFYTPPAVQDPYPVIPGHDVKNIIFLIGDGMGLAQLALTRLEVLGADGVLNMDRAPVTGIINTHSSDQVVTDSAAAGTAMACGIKTTNGTVGQDPDGIHYVSILEAAQALGKGTGLVATSSITHATPASFGAHDPKRGNANEIAEDLLGNRIHVMLGGGTNYFLPEEKDGKRTDDRNLVKEAKKANYNYITKGAQLDKAKGPYLLGLFAEDGLSTFRPEPTLAELSTKAISLLSQHEEGFFLMIEGSQIDWASHANDADNVIKQTLRFDEAVKVALDFALADRHTLVVITADHETGGLVVNGGSNKGADSEITAHWASKGHSAVPVGVFAFGPGASRFSGVYDNTQIPVEMARLLNIQPFPRKH
jgi:alkaline phosphatase